MYDTSNCPYFDENCPVCDDGECGCFECLDRIKELESLRVIPDTKAASWGEVV